MTGVLELTNLFFTGIDALFFFHVHIILDCCLFWSWCTGARSWTCWTWSLFSLNIMQLNCPVSGPVERAGPGAGGDLQYLELELARPWEGGGDLQQGVGQAPSGDRGVAWRWPGPLRHRGVALG